MKILVADNDHEMISLLSFWLKGHGYDVISTNIGDHVLKRFRDTMPDLVIIDVQMRKGFELCCQLRAETNAMILILTADNREDYEVRGMEKGADAYVRKPFSPRLLLAYIKALLRRAPSSQGAAKASLMKVGSVTYDMMNHQVIRNGVKITLTPTESRLLYLLMTHSGEIITHDTILERVWGYNETADPSIVKIHIHHLRKKLEPNAKGPIYIRSVPRLGYTFVAPTASNW